VEALLVAGERRVPLEDAPAPGGPARAVAVGAHHVLTGLDHVLFGLALGAVAGRLLVGAVVAFIVGHGVAAAAVAAGVLPGGHPVVELLIALSVVLLAREVRPPDGPPTWARRAPWAVAGACGLIHGAGFGGALGAEEAGIAAFGIAALGLTVGVASAQGGVAGAGAALALVADRLRYGRLVLQAALGVPAGVWAVQRLMAWAW
jgi:hypothetical protein